MNFDFECQPHTSNKAISSIYSELLLNDDQLNRRPAYQRSPVWDEEQKGYLIDTIMTRCPMPIFLLYACEDTNECIDGQNRLNTIKEYIEQTPDKPMWAWLREYEDRKEFIYFNNPKTQEAMAAYCDLKNKTKGKSRQKPKVYRLMNPQELKRFNAYQCTISEIQTRLTFDQRKEIFLRWQSGTGISQCDRLKNEDYPFCQFIIDQELEKTLATKICGFLNSYRRNWLYDLYRLVHVFYDGNDIADSALISTIKTLSKIKSNSDFSQEKTKDAIKRCDKFLSKFSFLSTNDWHISFILGLAFLWKCASENQGIRDVMEKEEFMLKFAKDIYADETLEKNTLNNGPQEKKILSQFPTIRQSLMCAIDEYSDQADTRTKKKSKAQIPAVRKSEVWNVYFGEDVGKAKCMCCGLKDIGQRDFSAGHVIPETDGGTIDVENLRPICAPCNYSMGCKNMISWMKKMYPGKILATVKCQS